MYFRDRRDAGMRLAMHLMQYRDRQDVLVLGLPRGGVPVASELARELNAPLDVFLVRKLGVPGHEELGMGAIATGGIRILHEGIVRELSISPDTIEMVTVNAQKELARREALYRGAYAPMPIEGRIVIVVDDGLATGSTMKAVLAALRQERAARLIVAVPTAPAQIVAEIQRMADEVVCLVTPEPFYAVGGSYADFSQTTDEEVSDLIRSLRERSMT